MSPHRPHRQAFTLLEVLAAATAMAAIAGALYASLHVAFQARGTALRAIEAVRTVEGAVDLMRQDIESAVLSKGELTGPFVAQQATDAAGKNDSLIFFAVGADPEADDAMGDVRKVEYSCDEAADRSGVNLVRHVTSNLLSEKEVAPREEVICRGVRSFTLRYFDGTNWQATWDSTTVDNALPTAVEITLELQPADKNALPGAAGYRLCRTVPIPCGQGTSASGTTTTTTGGAAAGGGKP
ncbi:MAG: type II secretion system protein GspJ [Planctomycetota bacterium]|nr:type II secretion system protein GspJ [Planctomycetota bacterium]